MIRSYTMPCRHFLLIAGIALLALSAHAQSTPLMEFNGDLDVSGDIAATTFNGQVIEDLVTSAGAITAVESTALVNMVESDSAMTANRVVIGDDGARGVNSSSVLYRQTQEMWGLGTTPTTRKLTVSGENSLQKQSGTH
jgi:di/tripeptidase